MPSGYQLRWSRLARQYAPYAPLPGPLANSFDGITPTGTTVTTANSGGISGSPFDVVIIGTSAAVTSDGTNPAHGVQCLVVSTGGTTAQALVQWGPASVGTRPVLYGRAYLKMAALPAVTNTVVRFDGGATTLARIQVTTTGQLRVADSPSSIISTFATTLPVGQWLRVEWRFAFPGAATGQSEVRLFLPMDSVTPAETQVTAASQNFGSQPCTAVSFGWAGAAAANEPNLFIDDIGLSSTAFPGPASLAYTTRTTPVRALPVIPVTAPWRGTAQGRTGAYGQAGPPVRPLQGPILARQPLPPRGRPQARAGTYGQTGPAVRAAPGPVRSRLPGPFLSGRARHATGPYGGTGPPVRQLQGPVKAQPAVPWRKGRSASDTAPPGGTGPRVRALTGPVRAAWPALARFARTIARTGTAGTAGPPAYPLGHPARPRQPLPPAGRAAGRQGTWRSPAPPVPLTVTASDARTGTLTAADSAAGTDAYAGTYGPTYGPDAAILTASDTRTGGPS